MALPKAPKKPGKPSRFARIERNPPRSIDDAENLGWAVSYSDLLMVLMSFFVIFYSAEKGDAGNLLASLTVKMKAKGVAESVRDPLKETKPKGSAAGSGVGNKGKGEGKGHNIDGEAGVAGLTDTQIYNNFATKLLDVMGTNGAGVTVETYKDFVLVMLSDNIFGNRQYELSADAKLELDEVFAVIRDLNRNVSITFVGHSDPTPVKTSAGLLTDNFVLSSIRAARALRYAVEKGIPEESLFVEGSAANVRSTRSLSVRVELR